MIKQIFLLIAILLLLPIGVAADTHIIPAPEEFYGNVTYTDGSVVEAGQITVTDIHGTIIGNYNMTRDGEYGEPGKSGMRLLAHSTYIENTLYFYVNSIKAVNRGKDFNSGEIMRNDIILPVSSKPTIIPTEIVNITPNVTEIITITVTPTPTLNGTVISNIPTQPIPTPTIQPHTDNSSKYIGIILMGISLCIVIVIIWYVVMSKHMKRDDDQEFEINMKK